MESVSQLLADQNSRAGDEQAAITAAQRDPGEFVVLYDRYATRLYRYIRTRTASEDDAADLCQVVFLRALDALPRYRPTGAPFAAWLFKIARNVVIDAGRKSHRSLEGDFLPEILQPGSEFGLDEEILRREEIEKLRKIVLQLAPEQREVLILRFVSELKSREIAIVTGKSKASIDKKLQRIMQQLKERYDVS